MPVYKVWSEVSFLDDGGPTDPEIKLIRGTMNVILVFEAGDDLAALKKYEMAAEHISDLCAEGEAGEIRIERGELQGNDFVPGGVLRSERLPRTQGRRT